MMPNGGQPMRKSYLVWFRRQFLGRVQAVSPEAAALPFGVPATDLEIRTEQDLSLDEWIEADAQLRA